MVTFLSVILAVQYYFLFIALMTNSLSMVMIENKRDLLLMWIPYVAILLWSKKLLKKLLIFVKKTYDELED